MANWIHVTSPDEVPEDDVLGVETAGLDLAIYSVDGEFYATDNICTHGHARLCDGFLEGYEIECPLHQGRFDVRTGKGLCEPITEDVRSYPLKIEDGKIWIQVVDASVE